MKKGIFAIVILLSLALLTINASAFNFEGFTHYTNGTIMPGVNVTLKIYTIENNGPRLYNISSTISNESGYFIIGLEDSDEDLSYQPILIKYNDSYNDSSDLVAQYVSKSLPLIPKEQFSNLGQVDFYLKPGATIRVTASTAPEPREARLFTYMLKDTSLAFTVEEDHINETEVKLFHVPAERNYSLILYPNTTMPIQYEITDLSSYSGGMYDLSFSLPIPRWDLTMTSVTGDINIEGSDPGLDNIKAIAFIMEPGNTISSHSAMPYNMSEWDDSGQYVGTINATNGEFNITLMHPGMDLNVMLMFIGYRNSSTQQYYIGYQNVTIGPTRNNSHLNIKLFNAAGNSTREFTLRTKEGSITIPTRAVNFSIVSDDGNLQSGLMLATVDYSSEIGMDFTWAIPISQQEDSSGGISWPSPRDPPMGEPDVIVALPLPAGYDLKKVEFYTEDYSPTKIKISSDKYADYDSGASTINLSTFSPGDIAGAVDRGDIFIDILKSNPSCNVPNYNFSNCSLLPTRVNLTEFNPLKVIIGGGEISFAMGRISTGLTIMYKNVDLIASGPPDVLFDDAAATSGSGEGLREAWRFGSTGPEIYDEVLIGYPYHSSLIPSTIKVHFPYLYEGSDFNTPIWNISADGTGTAVTGNLTEYASFDPSWFTESGPTCSLTDPTAICYIDTEHGKVWIRFPHFSGIRSDTNGDQESATTLTTNYTDSSDSSSTPGGKVAGEYKIIRADAGEENIVDVNDVNDNATSIVRIMFYVQSTAWYVKFKINELTALPTGTPEPEGKVYKIISIVMSNMETSNLKSAKIRFKVAKSWLESNNIKADSITLQRYANGRWEKLDTIKQSESDSNIFYDASTTGFSTFVITGVKAVEDEAKEVVEGKEETPTSVLPAVGQPKAEGEMKPSITAWLVSIAIVLAVLLVLALLMRKKGKLMFWREPTEGERMKSIRTSVMNRVKRQSRGD